VVEGAKNECDVTEPPSDWLEPSLSRLVMNVVLGKSCNLTIEEVETGAAEAYRAMADEYSHGTLFSQPLKYYSDSNYPPDSIVGRDLASRLRHDVSMLKKRGWKPLVEVKDVKAEFLHCSPVFSPPLTRFWILNVPIRLYRLYRLLQEDTLHSRVRLKITATERLTMVRVPSDEGEEEMGKEEERGKEEGEGEGEGHFTRRQHIIELWCSCPPKTFAGYFSDPYWGVRSLVKDDAIFNRILSPEDRPSWAPDVSICCFNMRGWRSL
jgi:hypothetical protein